MVSEDNFSDGVFNTRPALSDVTNRPAKRPFSSTSTDSPHKSTHGGDSHFAKQVCLGVENLVKKKCQFQFGANTQHNDKDKDKVPFQPKANNPSLKLPFCGAVGDTSLPNLSSQRLNSPSNDVTEEEQSLLGGAVVTSFGFGEDAQGRIACGASEGRPVTEGHSNRAIQSDDRDVGVVDKLASSKCVAVEPPTISASNDLAFLGLERCSALKGASSGANSATSSEDLLKYCTCSFCSKAAYIWSDLHYQDVKGRLGALKKSQKEASTMLQRFSALKDKVVHDPQSIAESTKLELSLMEQWKSLFVHMENTFAQETKQLESSFETLKDLRESCKSGLDFTDNSHSDNH